MYIELSHMKEKSRNNNKLDLKNIEVICDWYGIKFDDNAKLT